MEFHEQSNEFHAFGRLELTMTKTRKIESNDDAWETGALGQDEAHVKVSKSVNEEAIDKGLNLTPVTIRLQKSLVENFKSIAALNGIGYQPLMRQVLTRFADCEMKKIARDLLIEQGLSPDDEEIIDCEDELKRA